MPATRTPHEWSKLDSGYHYTDAEFKRMVADARKALGGKLVGWRLVQKTGAYLCLQVCCQQRDGTFRYHNTAI